MNGSGTGKYRVLQDIPVEVLEKLSHEELVEIYRGIDKDAQHEATMKAMQEIEWKMGPRHGFYGDEGEVDASDALLLGIDGPKLKETYFPLYRFLLDFQFDCMSNYGLQRFAPPDTCSTGLFITFDRPFGVPKLARKKLFSKKTSSLKKICHKHAIGALDVYNRYSKKPKLKFERVVAALKVIVNAKLVYVTFSAFNPETSQSGIYQAAITEHDGHYYLGLLRDYTNSKILAIISVSDAEEEIAAKRAYAECLPRLKLPLTTDEG